MRPEATGGVVAALDIGTTAAKAAIVARDGAVLARGQAGYPLQTGTGGRVEQNPADWWTAATEALQACRPRRFGIAALVLSGQMQDLILLGGQDLLRPAILYADGRAGAEADEVGRRIGYERWVAVTGNLQDGSSVLAKLLWLRKQEPDLYAQATALLLGAHDYVSWRAGGRRVTDPTNASTTGLFDLEQGGWAHDLLASLDLRADWLPAVVPPEQVVGEVSPDAARMLGVPAGTPLLHGAGDAATTTLGAGAGEPGRRYLYLGTSGWLALSAAGQRADPLTGIFTLAHPAAGRTILIGPMLTAGGNVEWLRQTVFGGAPVEEVSAAAASSPPGAGGALYFPHLARERSPFRDPDARAGFAGIHGATSRADLARAVLEGVACGFRSIADAAGGAGEELYAAGGGTRSDLWCRILANALRCTVRRLAAPEDVAVRGAAIVAGRALGWYASYDPGPEFFPVEGVFAPETELLASYDRVYAAFLAANPALQGRLRHVNHQKGVRT